MNKYIPAGKLIAEIERLKEETPIGICEYDKGEENGRYEVLNHLLSTITSLQQEQPALPGIKEPGIPGKDYIPVEWVDACEMYGKWKIVKQEQPEEVLEQEIDRWFGEKYMQNMEGLPIKPIVQIIARHFYGLRNRAIEEAARHVYESWMGGTMDDVRRDMVELGKVLNARK